MPNGLTVGFVDTNVLIYAFSEAAETDWRRSVAASLIDKLVFEERICLSTQVLLEFATNTIRLSKAPGAREALLASLSMLRRWPVFQVDPDAIEVAIRVKTSHQLSIWDALIVVSARRMGAGILYTEDLNHGQVIEGVRVVNPFLEEQAEGSPLPQEG